MRLQNAPAIWHIAFMKNFPTYLGLLFTRAAQNSVQLTDQLTVLLVPFSTLVCWLAGVKLTPSIQETLALSIAATVILVVALRLVAASYSVWNDDQARLATLQQELAAPERQLQAAMKAYTIEVRQALSTELGRLAAFCTQPSTALAEMKAPFDLPFLVSEVDRLTNQISYDVPARIAALRLRDSCILILSGERTGGEWFWTQRKITFRILHKQDLVEDFISLMELEILLEAEGLKNADSEDDSAAIELKKVMRAMGDRYYDPEVQQKLKQKLKNGQKASW